MSEIQSFEAQNVEAQGDFVLDITKENLPKHISEKSVHILYDGFSPSARAHSQRCKTLAEYILTCPGSSRIFLKRMVSEKLVAAIAYHDFGKAFIPKEAVNFRYCESESEQLAYRTHTEKAAEYIHEHSDIYSEEPASFDRFLLECSTMHHEHFDGTGFPNGASERKIPLVGRLCAAVNFIDHVLDFDNSEGLDMERVYKALEEAADKQLDGRICTLLLNHKRTFSEVCRDLYEAFEKDPDARSHIRLKYKGLYSSTDFSHVGYETEAAMYDADLGEVSAVLIRATSGDELALKLDELIRYRTFKAAEEFKEKGIDYKNLTLFESAATINRADYPKQLEEMLLDYGIDAQRITVCIPEEVLYNEPSGILFTLERLRDLGVRVSIDGFGELYKTFEIFERFSFDEIRLSSSFVRGIKESNEAFQVASAMISVARNLSVDVVCSEIASVGDEDMLAGMGVNILGGILYGKAVLAEELNSRLDAKVGDADG